MEEGEQHPAHAVAVVAPPAADASPLLPQGMAKKALIVAVFGIATYGAILFYADADVFAAHAARYTLPVLALATAVSCVNFVFRFVRWHYYLRLLSVSLPLVDSALIFLSGFTMSISPGKMGEVLKAVMVRDATGVPVRHTAPIVIAERLTDVAALFLLGGVGLGVSHGKPVYAALAAGSVVLIGMIGGSTRLATGCVVLATTPQFLRRLRQPLLDMVASLRAMVAPWPYVVGTVLSVVGWAAHGFCLYVVAFDFDELSVSVADSMLAYSAPLLAGTLAMIPGGLGLTEASMVGVIKAAGGPHATVAAATAIALMVRMVTFWLAIAIGGVALVAWRARRANASSVSA